QRVELALDQPHGLLIGDAEQSRADHRDAGRARVLARLDQRLPRDIDDRDELALEPALVARVILRLDPDLVVRDQDLVIVAELGRGLQPQAVDVRAVVTAEILERPTLAIAPQPRVLP